MQTRAYSGPTYTTVAAQNKAVTAIVKLLSTYYRARMDDKEEGGPALGLRPIPWVQPSCQRKRRLLFVALSKENAAVNPRSEYRGAVVHVGGPRHPDTEPSSPCVGEESAAVRSNRVGARAPRRFSRVRAGAESYACIGRRGVAARATRWGRVLFFGPKGREGRNGKVDLVDSGITACTKLILRMFII